jgi:hypothetical protein
MKSILMAASALALLCGTAFAQTSTSGSTSGANVNTISGSQSAAVSNPRVNVYGNPIGNGASSSNSAANSRSNSRSNSNASGGQSSSTSGVTINNSYGSAAAIPGATGASPVVDPAAATGTLASTGTGTGTGTGTNYTSTQTIRNTPEVIAPSIVGGNPCTVGASTGLALPGFGIVGGGSWEGKGCERRQLAALLFNMGHDNPTERGQLLQQAAVEVLCKNDDVRDALARVGQPCVGDRVVAAVPAAPVAVASAPLTPAPTVAAKAPVERAAMKQRPEWCYTASAAEQRAHAVCAVTS